MTLALRIRHYAGLVAFSHTIFALPFAATAALLALREPHLPLTPVRVLALLVALVAARTSAMAWNRWADRDVDAKNPRTQSRHLPARLVTAREVLLLAVLSGAAFVAVAAWLGTWPLVLALPVLLVLWGYSFAKRFTWAAHLWLGVALALAPGGVWIALGCTPGPGILCLMFAVVTWLFGFDILYSLQDEVFDRTEGLHSVPARFGTRRALLLSEIAHVFTVMAFVATGLLFHRGPFFAMGVGIAAALLAYEHFLVRRYGLAKIDRAFFDLNAYVSVAFFLLTLLDEMVLRAHP